MCSWKTGIARGQREVEEEQLIIETREENEDERVEKLIELMKEINGKFNKQIKEVRDEIRQEIEGIKREMQQTKESWERKCVDMSRDWKTDLNKIKDDLEGQILQLRMVTQEDMQDKTELNEKKTMESEMELIGKNKRMITLVYKEVQECSQHWSNRFKEIQENIGVIVEETCSNVKIELERKLEEMGKRIEHRSSKPVERDLTRMGKKNHILENESTQLRGDSIPRSRGSRDQTFVQDVQMYKFDEDEGLNPKRFMQDLVEFFEIRDVPDDWKVLYFRKYLGAKTLLWSEAIGKNSINFEDLRMKFLRKYWSAKKQFEVIRRFYMPVDIDYIRELKKNICWRRAETINI